MFGQKTLVFIPAVVFRSGVHQRRAITRTRPNSNIENIMARVANGRARLANARWQVLFTVFFYAVLAMGGNISTTLGRKQLASIANENGLMGRVISTSDGAGAVIVVDFVGTGFFGAVIVRAIFYSGGHLDRL